MKKNCLIKEKNTYHFICIFICILLLLPLFIISIYNRPSADDFNYAIRTHNAVLEGKGFFGIIKEAFNTDMEFYNKWQGLYSSAFLLALQPAIFGEEFYAISPFVIFFSTYLFTFLSVHILNKMFFKKPILFSVTLSLLVITIIMLLLPSAVEGIYWYNGAVNYMPWAFSNIFNICLLLRIRSNIKSVKGVIYLIISTILAFLTSGGNHVTGFANILFLIILTLFLLFNKKYYSILPLIAALVGFVIMYMAPGTAIRASYFEQQSVLDTVIEVIKYIRNIAHEWINIQWLLCMIAVTPIGILVAYNCKNKLPKYIPFVSIILSMLVICGMLSVPYMSIGNFGALRVTNVVWLTFIFLSWFNYILLLIIFIQSKILNFEKLIFNRHFTKVSTCVVCLSVVILFFSVGNYGPSNSYTALRELKNGIARDYAEEMDERFERYNDGSLNEVKVRPLKVKSKILFFRDVGENPDVSPNSYTGEYYGKKIYLVD